MPETFRIRPYRVKDLPQVEALKARIQPYRPEDEDAVQIMFARALQADQANDPRWMGFPVLSDRTIAQEFDAFWVAERLEENMKDLVGIVGVQAFRAGEVISPEHPLAQSWLERGRVAELRRLRVAPEMRGKGLGSRLCQVVVNWTRAHGFSMLVVNTTTPQLPALQLYRRLGFHEVGISYIDRYELVWLELIL